MIQPWFSGAKLGIFIHWGLYSVKGIPESWSWFNGEISHDDYFAQREGFTAANYDPQAWADLFERAGAKYAVLTTKHHDGFALWPTGESELKASRDLVGPYCAALREKGLHVGLYFSHLDWSHPDYSAVPIKSRGAEKMRNADESWTLAADSPEWERYVAFHRAQLKELCTRYQPELLWFDGSWEPTESYWRYPELSASLHEWQPNVILNSRMGGYGDYETPEQGVPIVAPEGPWEFCVTINDSWGYQPNDHNHKSVRQLVRMFCECIGMGGNMLLDVGPRADGTIQPEHVERLEALGAWIRPHEEAIYSTGAGLPAGHFYGASTLSSDQATLYLFLFDRPWDEVAVKGLLNKVKRVSVVGSGNEVAHRMIGGAPWAGVPGVLWIDVPESEIDPNSTVLKVEFDGPLSLYRGSGHAIESN
jgi:alpha-L-fucosidase